MRSLAAMSLPVVRQRAARLPGPPFPVPSGLGGTSGSRRAHLAQPRAGAGGRLLGVFPGEVLVVVEPGRGDRRAGRARVAALPGAGRLLLPGLFLPLFVAPAGGVRPALLLL